MKPFTTLDEQLKILEERGMNIPDKEDARSYLLDNNYYNVVNMYSKFFQENTNQYIPGVNFSEIKALHIFDTEVKAILLKYILVAEKHFKSIFAHYFAEKNKTGTFSYLNTNVYNNATPMEITRTLSDISKTINFAVKSKQSNSIKHYVEREGDVPIWVVINELEFGTVAHMFKFCDNSIRNKVARRLSDFLFSNIGKRLIIEPNSIDTMLGNIIQIRNCAAHNNKLLNFKCRNNLAYVPEIHDIFDIKSDAPKQSVFTVFLALQYFLPYADYVILYNTILKRSKTQSKKINTIEMNKIINSYGFPDDWHTTVSRKQ